MNLFTFLNRQRRWSRNTFGDGQRTEGILRHLEKEIAEIRQTPDDIDEWADVVILALDGAWRRGFTPHDICQAIQRKQHTNMAREWKVPTSEDEPCEHVTPLQEGWRRDAVAGGQYVTYRFTGNVLLCSHRVYQAVEIDDTEYFPFGMHATYDYHGVTYKELIVRKTIKTSDDGEDRYLLLVCDSRGEPNAGWRVADSFRSLKARPGAFRDPYMSRAEYECIMSVMDDCCCRARSLPDHDGFLALLAEYKMVYGSGGGVDRPGLGGKDNESNG